MTLLAAYNFDEASGNVLDVTGNGHGFTPGAGITRQTGHTNTGLRHESTAADSPGPAVFGQTAQRTLMCWVRRTSNSVDGWIVEMKNGGASTGVWGFLYTGGNVQARAKNSSNAATFVQVTQPSVNNWHHLAMTYDGSNIRLYIDGSLVGSPAAFAGPIWTSATIFPFFDTVGTETVIDDVRVYDEALSQATIATLMGTPVTGGPTGTGAVAAPASIAAGTGTVIAAGSGASTAPAATAGGTATVAVAGTGQSTAPPAAASGSASVLTSGSGQLAAPAATASGTGGATITGNGQANAAPASTAGTGTIDVDGTGQLTAPAAAVAGTGTFGSPPSQGDGSLTATPALVAGSGSVLASGSGLVEPPAAVADGDGAVLVTGSGAVVAQPAVLSGAGRQAARRTPRTHAGTTTRAVGTPKRTARLHAGTTPRH